MFRDDVNKLIKDMGALCRIQKNGFGEERGVVFKHCPFCFGIEVSAIPYSTGMFYCKACGARHDLKEMRSRFVKEKSHSPKSTDTDWRNMDTVKCPICLDRGVIIGHYKNGADYVRPCNCETARIRYAGLIDRQNPYTEKERNWNREYQEDKMELLVKGVGTG